MAIVLSKAQREIVKKLIIYLVVLVIAIIIPMYLSSTLEDYEKKDKWLENDIIELGRKLDGLNKKTLEFLDTVKTWEGLSEEDKKLQGLRINDAKEMLENLQNKYRFNMVKTSFSKPEEIAGEYKTDTVSLSSSLVSLSFNALSDEFIYNFISDLKTNFPGFIQIKNLNINKPSTITKDILKKISAGEDAPVISVTIDFYWHDLKYKGPTTPPMPTGGTPPK